MAKGQTNSVETPVDEATVENKRNKISSFTYVDNDGETSKQVKPESVGLVAEFANGEKRRLMIDQLSTAILAQATLQGLSIKLQRSFASSGSDVAEAVDSFDTVYENLLSGIWATKAEGKGPRLSILAEAVEAVLVEAGQDVDESRREAIVEKLKDEATREKTQKDPKVKAHYERIKAARAAERAAKASEAAGKVESTIATDF